jgi:hypothetical protein
MEVSGQLFALATSPPGKETLVHTEQKDRWVPEAVQMLWKKENLTAAAKN